MRALKLLGLVEEYGEGIDRMYELMDASGTSASPTPSGVRSRLHAVKAPLPGAGSCN